MNLRSPLAQEITLAILQFTIPFGATYFLANTFDSQATTFQKLGLSLLFATAFKVLIEVWSLRVKLRVHLEHSASAEILHDHQEVIRAARDLMADRSLTSSDVRVFQGRPISFAREKSYFAKVAKALSTGRVAVFHRAAYVGSTSDVAQLKQNISLLSKKLDQSGRVLIYPIFSSFNMSFLLFDNERCQIALPNLAGGENDDRPDCGLAVRDATLATSLLKIFHAMTQGVEPIRVPASDDKDAIDEAARKLKNLEEQLELRDS